MTDLATTNPVRAPRLTANRLSDLQVAAEALAEDTAYLADACKSTHLPEYLRERFAEKAAALGRAQQWLAGKIAAERAHRGDA